MKDFKTGNFKGTVLFIDIRNYLGISNILSPKETCKFIFRVIEPLCDCIKAHNGYICQIQGDAILAIFGLESTAENHASAAVDCALSLQVILNNMNPININHVRVPLSASVGISTGSMYACNIHVGDRREFTVLGRTVNMASRYQKLNKHYNTNILIDETVFAYIKKDIATRKLDKVNIEGCSEPVGLFEVLYLQTGSEKYMNKSKLYFKKGLINYIRREWDEAIENFSHVSEDRVCYRMIRFCKERKAFQKFNDDRLKKK